ncbi:hypothetical protein J7L48_08915 [bacterium]|nr:hypothetical protein [bacterium]
MKSSKNSSLPSNIKLCPKCQNIIFSAEEYFYMGNKKYVKCSHCNEIFEIKHLPQKYSKLFQLFYLLILIVLVILKLTRIMTIKTFLIGTAMTIVAYFIDLFFSISKKDINKIELESADMGIYMGLKDHDKITLYPKIPNEKETNGK